MFTRGRTVGAPLFLLIVLSACGGDRMAETPEARRTRGMDLLNDAFSRIAAAESLTFTAHEVGERVRRSGEKRPVSIDSQVAIRRPDRLHLKTSGDLDLEAFYDGKQITLLSHQQKVYGVVPASGTLDEVIHDAMHRYDIPFPIGDIVTFTSAERLINEDTQGGWAGEETINGRRTHKLAWQHPNLDWTVWVTAEGDHLPVRLELHYKARRGQPRRLYDLGGWQFAATLPDAIFAANVPSEYEGIPVIQRASAVLDRTGQAAKEQP
jgi:hypothetical protein